MQSSHESLWYTLIHIRPHYTRQAFQQKKITGELNRYPKRGEEKQFAWLFEMITRVTRKIASSASLVRARSCNHILAFLRPQEDHADHFFRFPGPTRFFLLSHHGFKSEYSHRVGAGTHFSSILHGISALVKNSSFSSLL